MENYSVKNLHKESDLFFDWYLPLIMKKNKALKIKKVLKQKLQILYKKLKFKNNIFVHRDFHVSNLMKINNQHWSNRFPRCNYWKSYLRSSITY